MLADLRFALRGFRRNPEPSTFVVLAAALLSVATLASLLPARRATRANPMVALRSE
jgi:ABC-type lipoprotein release transport system permease subunit